MSASESERGMHTHQTATTTASQPASQPEPNRRLPLKKSDGISNARTYIDSLARAAGAGKQHARTKNRVTISMCWRHLAEARRRRRRGRRASASSRTHRNGAASPFGRAGEIESECAVGGCLLQNTYFNGECECVRASVCVLYERAANPCAG